MKKFLKEYGNYLVWGTALAGTLGSFYFSEVMNLVPCVLCWYQRMALAPLVLLVGVGILKKNPDMPVYVLPFSIAGLGVGIFQNLLYYGVISEELSPCTIGISCVDPANQLLGWGITIPMLSTIAFAVITIIMLINSPAGEKGKENNG